MLVFYYYYVGGWYGSAVMFIILQLVPDYKEQMIDYYGISILLNLINLASWAVFYCLYGGVHLFKIYKKCHAWQPFFARLTLFPFKNIAPTFTD